jgi:NAD(P)-dependent dehydrogenase (short-subunit alcohol dehydrogenase family)
MVVLITGAGSGMGRLAAQRALQQGRKVAALDVSAAGLDHLGDSPALLKLCVDVRDAAAVADAVARVERELGPIERVMNAAAIMPLGLALEQDPAITQRIMSINYFGLVHIAHAALPPMLARGRGEFVSFSSMAGLMPTRYVAAYDASKFAVTAYTEVLAEENRNRGVRFACVCPPMVATPLLQQARDTVWPRIFDVMPPLKPEFVLDCIERALSRGRFWVLPGATTPIIAWLRRFSPSLLWWINRMVERYGARPSRTSKPSDSTRVAR